MPSGKSVGMHQVGLALPLAGHCDDSVDVATSDLTHCGVNVGTLALEPTGHAVLSTQAVGIDVFIKLIQELDGAVCRLEVVGVETRSVVMSNEGTMLNQMVVKR